MPPVAIYAPVIVPGPAADAALSVAFGFFYYDPINTQSWNDYDYRVVFSMLEIVLLISFEIYLVSFLAPMYRYERYRLDRAD